MKLRQVMLIGLAAMSLAWSREAVAAEARTSKPNILLIVADDLGFGDCGFNGGRDIPTPNIDALAASGIHFTNGYVSGTVCSPSRAALMTGRYQYRDGVDDWIRPRSASGLNAKVPTIADYMKKAGYRTALIGKWHLGEQEEYNPLNRGFEEFYGFLGGGRDYFPYSPKKRLSSNRRISTRLVRGREPVVEPEYTTHAFGQEAVNFISRQAKEGHPFFLYLAFNAVHNPMQAPKDYLQRFASIDNMGRRTYAGMLSAMDDNIGRVLKTVRDAGIEENTLICFISDNGGPITRCSPNHSTNGPLRGGKGETWEGGIHVPFLMKWNGHLKSGTTFTQPVIQMDLTATIIALAGMKADPKWPIDGVDLMPFLTGDQTKSPHESLCWESVGQWAIRKGNWKLVFALPPARNASIPIFGLFDLSKDIGEKHDLSASQPELVKELQAEWATWHKSVGGKPAPKVIHVGINADPT